MVARSATRPKPLWEDTRRGVQAIEEKAALLTLAVAGIGAEDYDVAVVSEPAVRLAQGFTATFLALMEVLDVKA